jgi:hypothetical protein
MTAPNADPVSAALQDAADEAAADFRWLHQKARESSELADKLARVGASCEPGAHRDYYAEAHKRAVAIADRFARAADAVERDARR